MPSRLTSSHKNPHAPVVGHHQAWKSARVGLLVEARGSIFRGFGMASNWLLVMQF